VIVIDEAAQPSSNARITNPCFLAAAGAVKDEDESHGSSSSEDHS
jgi:hypothetical protein